MVSAVGGAKNKAKKRRIDPNTGLPIPQQKNSTPEDIFRELMEKQRRMAEVQQQRTIELAPEEVQPKLIVRKNIEAPKDDVFSYDQEYEGKDYDMKKQKELQNIRNKRALGEHLSSSLPDEGFEVVVKKKAKSKNKNLRKFKFNAKDAIIYDVILNRKYQ